MTEERHVLTNIIERYKEMPYLWDKNNQSYMDKDVRNKGYKVLFSVYKTFDKDAALKTLKKKLDNLKTNYYRELKKVKASKSTVTGTGSVYIPTIWYYNNFSFLESTAASTSPGIDTNNNPEGLSCNPAPHIREELPLQLQKNRLEKVFHSMEGKENDWEILGKCIGMQLRDLDKDQQTIARKLVSDVIYFGTLGQLNGGWRVAPYEYPCSSPASTSASHSPFKNLQVLPNSQPLTPTHFPSNVAFPTLPQQIQSPPHSTTVQSPHFSQGVQSPQFSQSVQTPHIEDADSVIQIHIPEETLEQVSPFLEGAEEALSDFLIFK